MLHLHHSCIAVFLATSKVCYCSVNVQELPLLWRHCCQFWKLSQPKSAISLCKKSAWRLREIVTCFQSQTLQAIQIRISAIVNTIETLPKLQTLSKYLLAIFVNKSTEILSFHTTFRSFSSSPFYPPLHDKSSFFPQLGGELILFFHHIILDSRPYQLLLPTLSALSKFLGPLFLNPPQNEASLAYKWSSRALSERNPALCISKIWISNIAYQWFEFTISLA